MKFNIFKFYRLDFCLRNLGLGLIGITSANCLLGQKHSIFALLNILFIQMHSFSMNNYFDYEIWGEKNYINTLVLQGLNRKIIFFLTLVPLFLISPIIVFYNKYFFLLALYVLAFYFYQVPLFRMKNHYLLSIVINAFCLGFILYAYPFLFVADGFNIMSISFSLVFFFYLAFYELIHQIAHLGHDKIYALPSRIGIKNTIMVGKLFLYAVLITALIAVSKDVLKYAVFFITIFFSMLRLNKLKNISPVQREFVKLRNRADRFYMMQEGIIYLVILTWQNLFT